MRILAWLILILLVSTPALADETLLFLRHGEKPAAGLGQLSCRGLNRALAIPGVLAKMYGRIDAVFAPDPARQKPDGDRAVDGLKTSYDYVRPLATAEPTAIYFGLPVHADYGFDDIGALKTALLGPAYRNARVLVVWEHNQIADLVPQILTELGDAAKVPDWPKHEFDAIWEVRIKWDSRPPTAAFARRVQGLDQLSERCPAP